MTLNVTHAFVSAIADDPTAVNAGEVVPSNWNANHVVSVDSDGFNTFYVSPSGSDSNSGTKQSAAWQTIAHVNAQTFGPGSVILFQGGQTFSGAIVCPSTGTPGAPIIFGSYGGGQATISSGTSNGFTSTNQAGIILRDLTFTGSASTNHGVLFTNALSGNVHLQNIQCINLNISGYGRNGIYIQGNNGSAGYDDVLIAGCIVSSCCSVAFSGHGTAGINVSTFAGYGLAINNPTYNNVVIDNCLVSSCAGAVDTNWTGSGIFISQVKQGIIRNSKAISCGASSNPSNNSGPVGIWTGDSIGVIIESCRSISNSTLAAVDGAGFDLDGGCTDCEIRDCYSEGNAGPGFQVVSYTDGSVTSNDKNRISNCTSNNDCIAIAQGGILIFNGTSATLTNCNISGCTVYLLTTNGAACLDFAGANASAITGKALNLSFNVSANQTNINGSIPGGITISGIWRTGSSSATSEMIINGANKLDYNITNSAGWTFNSANGIYTQFATYLGATTTGPGTFVRLNADTGDRAILAIDGSDRPYLSFGAGGSAALDATLWHPATYTMGLIGTDPFVFSSHPAIFQVYNSADSPVPSNYERGTFGWSGNVLNIGTEALGSGSVRNIQFIVGGIDKLDYGVSSAGQWTFGANVIAIGNTIDFSYFLAEHSTGNAPGLYVRISGDSSYRLKAFLDASDKPILAFGTGSALDTGISRIAPVSSVPTIAIGNGTAADASGTIQAKTKAGAPTASDVPAGTWVLIRDTTNSTTKLYYNNAGTLQTVALT